VRDLAKGENKKNMENVKHYDNKHRYIRIEIYQMKTTYAYQGNFEITIVDRYRKY
jgi:hypothetical protein